jgi:VIT1/CCC1 family predicted Fe2+/Mn2+ transporter
MHTTVDLRKISFGGPAAIVTGMALIVGLDAATVGKVTVITSLLIIGLADNLTDSLSVHIYQESERLAQGDALRTTIANFLVRLLVSISFILVLLLLPTSTAIYVATVWGFVLLSILSYLLARARRVGPFSEVLKHTAIALIVIATSRAIGSLLPALMGST